jgi:hypothetical protein
MSNSQPPPLPDFKSAVKTYARALLYLITAGFFILFAHTMLSPKMEQLWKEVGQRSVPLGMMFSTVEFLKSFAVPICFGIAILLGVLEATARWWRRFRGVFVEVIVYLVFVTTISMYASIAIAASALAPLLNRPQ